MEIGKLDTTFSVQFIFSPFFRAARHPTSAALLFNHFKNTAGAKLTSSTQVPSLKYPAEYVCDDRQREPKIVSLPRPRRIFSNGGNNKRGVVMSRFSQQKLCYHCGSVMVRTSHRRKKDSNSKYYWKNIFHCTGCSQMEVQIVPCGQSRSFGMIQSWHKWLKETVGSSCEICGYDRSWRALEFHHIDAENKRFGISNYTRRNGFTPENKELVKEELENTILICANCHREVHDNIMCIWKPKEGNYEHKAA